MATIADGTAMATIADGTATSSDKEDGMATIADGTSPIVDGMASIIDGMATIVDGKDGDESARRTARRPAAVTRKRPSAAAPQVVQKRPAGRCLV